MSKHTPGPWAVVDGHYSWIQEIKGPSFSVKAVVGATDLSPEDYDKRAADLRLIAAAPELLDLVERAVRRLQIDHSIGSGILREWVIDAREAIRKATGEQA